jgi:hypothetical protein
MNRLHTDSKRDSQTFLLFPGITEETQWRPMPTPPIRHQPAPEERSIEEDIERWDGLA